VLVVDDDFANRVLLTRLLARAGYEPLAAVDGMSALAAARSDPPDAILLDVGLPDLDGLDVCRGLRSDPATAITPIILVTGRSDPRDVVVGLDAGADDFLTKPFDHAELLARVRSALRLRQAMVGMEAAHGVVAALANAVEAKDVTTEQHCQRLAALAHRLAVEVGITGIDLKAVVFGALLHDVGKIGVSERILTKPGPLTEDEWAEMRRHPEIGEQICRPLTSSRLFAPIVRHHHERWDGHGYPDRLRRDEIPLGARIVGLVDAFDAMVHDRPYRPALSLEQAVDEIRSNAGRQFDPALVPLFIAAVDSGRSPVPNRLPTRALLALAG